MDANTLEAIQSVAIAIGAIGCTWAFFWGLSKM